MDQDGNRSKKIRKKGAAEKEPHEERVVFVFKV
jgi:hypothetical protein